METIRQITDYVLFEPVSPNSKYFYVRCETQGLNTHSWFVGYKNQFGLVSSVGAPPEARFAAHLEQRYQNSIQK